MDQLQHDSLTKHQIKEALYRLLYNPVHEQHLTQIQSIIVRNTLMCGYSHKSFVYKGQVYSCDIEPISIRQNRLNPELRPLMEQYLNDIKQLHDEEMTYVFGFINQAFLEFPSYSINTTSVMSGLIC